MNAPSVDLHADQSQALVEIAGTGTIEAVEIARLKFDDYQRQLSNEFVQEMAGNWDPKVAGAIVVNRRPNGALYVIDGQHRTAAAKTAGEKLILAVVFDNLSRQQEAAMRVRGNVRKAEQPQEAFRAKLASGDKESLAIVAIAEEYGAKINTVPNGKVGIDCIGTIEKLYRKDDGELLRRTLDVMTRAWGTVSGEHARVGVLRAVAHVLEVNADEVDDARLVDRLQQEGTTGLRMKANSNQATWGGSKATNFYRALVEVYNTGLSQRHRIHRRIQGKE